VGGGGGIVIIICLKTQWAEINVLHAHVFALVRVRQNVAPAAAKEADDVAAAIVMVFRNNRRHAKPAVDAALATGLLDEN
jgi:hypothetical protein